MKPKISQIPQIGEGRFRGSLVYSFVPDELLRGSRATSLASLISIICGFFAVLIAPSPVLADPGAPVVSVETPSKGPSSKDFVTVSRLGEPDQQAALRVGQLLSHRRATDPFGNTIRGPYKALPPVVEHPISTPGPSTSTAASPVVVNVPTLEKAVQELAIGAVNVGAHEMLIGSRSVREGDLLVLESGGRQFVVWVQDIGVRGVMFCDIDMQAHFLKPFGSGPKELPESSVWGTSDIHHFLNKNAEQ